MNSRKLLGILVVSLLLVVPRTGRAQELNLSTLDEGPVNRAHLRTGAEYGFVVGVGYARALPLVDRHILLTGDITFPWATPDISDYQVRIGGLAPIVGQRHWRLAGTLAPTLRSTRNDVARMTGLGIDFGLLGGYYARHWFAAGEVGFDWVVTTHVSHSDRYRQVVYAEARDGWYGLPGGNLRGGVQIGGSFARYDLVLRAGLLRNSSGESPLFPIYGTLTFDTRW